ncbi:hypothetical protein ACHAXT_001628 [Thalassiosira profunda]
MGEEHALRRRLLAAALVGCAIAAFLCTSRVLPSRPSADVAGGVVAAQVEGQRLRLVSNATEMAMGGGIKRARTHRIPTVDIAAAEKSPEIKVAASPSSGGSPAGIATTDAHGLPVEIASSQPYSDADTATFEVPKAAWIPPATRIINGVPLSRAAHPYIARMHWKYPGENADASPLRTAYCGGSLIAPNIVLTAAHCLGNHAKYVDLYDVQLGRPKTYRIEQTMLHPLFDETVFGYDFGLAVLAENHVEAVTNRRHGEDFWGVKDAEEYDWANAPPIIRLHRYPDEGSAATKRAGCGALSQRQSEEVTTLTVIGYGATKFGPDGASDPSHSVLQGADVHYLLNEECNEQYAKELDGATLPSRVDGKIITDDMLCAWDNDEGQDACSGDSGGPLVAHLTTETGGGSVPSQVGITSWGIGCALSKYPGVYSRVADQMHWIEGEICGRNVKRSRGKKGSGLSPLSCVTNEDNERHLRDYAADFKMQQKRAGVSSSSTGMRRAHEAANRAKKGGRKEEKLLKQSRMESCELLEGRAIVDASKPTDRPTKQPRKADDGERDVDLTASCPEGIKRDVKFFHVGSAKNPRQKSCRWVLRKCRKRCDEYAVCCPETCAAEKCLE